jgi:hypothetical protein
VAGQLGFAPTATALALLLERDLEPGPVDGHPVLGRQLDGQVDREAVSVVQPERDIAGQDRCVGRQVLGAHTNLPLGRGERDQRLLEVDRASVEGARELALLGRDDGRDLAAPLPKMRVRTMRRMTYPRPSLDGRTPSPARKVIARAWSAMTW